jgi:hypothetical protein
LREAIRNVEHAAHDGREHAYFGQAGAFGKRLQQVLVSATPVADGGLHAGVKALGEFAVLATQHQVVLHRSMTSLSSAMSMGLSR